MIDTRSFARKQYRTARQRGIRNACRESIQEIGLKAFSAAHSHLFDRGRLIWDDEWDICLVADATRWDLYKEVESEYSMLREGETGSEWSVGSASPEWYGVTFHPDNIPSDERIGVVTANPFAGKIERQMPRLLRDATPIDRHDLVLVDYVYRDAWGCEVEDGYLDVVAPETVTDRAYRAWTENELDRLIIHYMQPHLPFRTHPEWFGRRENLKHFGEPDEATYPAENKEIWKQVRDGERTRDEVWKAYRDNLRWVLGEIERLYKHVDAEILLTADHGNGIGEWGVWSHPPRMHTPELRRVPWIHMQGLGANGWEETEQERREIETDIEAQLEALGYR